MGKKRVVRGPQQEFQLATGVGGVKGAKKLKDMLVRIPLELHRRLLHAMSIEAAFGPAFAPVPSLNGTVRGAIASYVTQWESIEASPEAKHAGKVLRGAVRR